MSQKPSNAELAGRLRAFADRCRLIHRCGSPGALIKPWLDRAETLDLAAARLEQPARRQRCPVALLAWVGVVVLWAAIVVASFVWR